MRKIINYLTAFLLVTITFTACKDDFTIYDGPTVVEFVPATVSVAKGTTANPGTAVATVQLVGPQVASPTEVNYQIATTGTGVNGTHYTIGGTAGKITIPANSSKGTVTITAIPANITSGTKTVVLTLLGNSVIAASANYKTFTLTITQ